MGERGLGLGGDRGKLLVTIHVLGKRVRSVCEGVRFGRESERRRGLIGSCRCHSILSGY